MKLSNAQEYRLLVANGSGRDIAWAEKRTANAIVRKGLAVFTARGWFKLTPAGKKHAQTLLETTWAGTQISAFARNI